MNWNQINSDNPPTLSNNTDIFGQEIKDYKPYSRSLPTFLALFIFGMIYLFGLSWDALRLKNTIQIIGICCFNWILCLYGILQEVQIGDAIKFLGPVTANSPEGGVDSGRSLEGQPESVRATTAMVGQLAEARRTSREAIVLAWLMKHPAAIQPVIGTTHPDRIAACADAPRIQLTREEWYSLYVSSRGAALP